MEKQREEEQKADQSYVDGFNIGYEIQKNLDDQSLSEKDRAIYEQLAQVIHNAKSKNDKLAGMIDGRAQFVKDRVQKQLKERANQNEQLKGRSKGR